MKFLALAPVVILLFVGCAKERVIVIGKVSDGSYGSNIKLGEHTAFSLTTASGNVLYLAVPGRRTDIKIGVNMEVVYENESVSQESSFYEKKNPDGSTTIVTVVIEYLRVISYKILD